MQGSIPSLLTTLILLKTSLVPFATTGNIHLRQKIPGTLRCLLFSFWNFFASNLGVNSGVMMMNLTRMREFDWTQRMWPIYKKYQTALTWGDQDIINIVFAGNPEKLYVFDCAWNYRPDHCMYMSVCKRSKQDGAFIVHGSRGFSHSDKQPPFKLLYEAFQRFRAEKDDLATNLVQPLQNALAGLDTSKSNCAKVYNIFLKQLMSRTKTQL